MCTFNLRFYPIVPPPERFILTEPSLEIVPLVARYTFPSHGDFIDVVVVGVVTAALLVTALVLNLGYYIYIRKKGIYIMKEQLITPWQAAIGALQFARHIIIVGFPGCVYKQGLIEPPKAARGHVTAWLAKCKVLLNLAHRSSTT